MVTLALAAVFGVILYRMSMVAALNVVDEETIKGNASLFISATGASINLVCILVFNQVDNLIDYYTLAQGIVDFSRPMASNA